MTTIRVLMPIMSSLLTSDRSHAWAFPHLYEIIKLPIAALRGYWEMPNIYLRILFLRTSFTRFSVTVIQTVTQPLGMIHPLQIATSKITVKMNQRIVLKSKLWLIISLNFKSSFREIPYFSYISIFNQRKGLLEVIAFNVFLIMIRPFCICCV